MTTRIADFSDSVTSAVPIATNIPAGPQGVPGQAFQLDETGVTFTETVRMRIETYGTPGSTDPNPNHGEVSTTNPYVILIITDSRTELERTNGPVALNSDLSRHVIEWNGITEATWFDYGEFTAVDSSKWLVGDGVPANSLGVDSDIYLDTGETIEAEAGNVYGPKANGNWPSTPAVNIAAGGLTTVDTDGEGLGGNGSAATPLFIELNGSTLEKSATGLKLGATFETRLNRYPTPATDGTDDGKVNVANASGTYILTTGDKTLVGLGYIPSQFVTDDAYTAGDLVFFEGINYKAKNTIAMASTDPDDDPTNWESLGGGGVQLVDGTGSSDVTIEQRGKLKITGQAEVTDQGAMADQADIFIPGADPVGFNLFSKGTMELAKAADYTASGGTFTIATGAALRGTRSANWSLPTETTTLTSPLIDIPVGYRAKLVQFSMIYKSQGPATLTLRDGSTNLQTIDLPAFTAANGSKKIVTFQQLGTTQSTIDFVITAGAGITAFNFDDVVITDDFQAGGQLTNVKRSIFTRIPQAATSPSLASVDSRIVDWNTSVGEVVEGDGNPVVSYSRTSANGSVWTAQQDCRVEGFYSIGLGTTGEASGYSVNSTQLSSNIPNIASENVVSIGQISTSDSPRIIPTNFELKRGDVFRCHTGNNNTRDNSEWRLSLKFEKIETQDVTVYNAQTSAANSFSAKLAGRTSNGAVTVLSESNSFISSAVRADGVDGTVYNITFNTGMFTETPVITAQIQADPGSNIDTAELFNVSTTGCSVQMFRDNAGGSTNTNLNNNFWLVVDRQGSDVRSSTANFVVPVIDITENEFSARISGSTPPVITSESSTFIQSVSRPGTGFIDVVFVPGFFTEIPSVVGSIEDNLRTFHIVVDTLTTSGFRYGIELGGSAQADSPADITVQRQGTDYIAPKKIDVPLEIIRTSSGIENTFSAFIDGVSSTPAVSTENVKFIESITDNGTGNYTLNFVTDFFSVKPVLECTVDGNANSDRVIIVRTSSATSAQIIIEDISAATEVDNNFFITAHRQGTDYKAPEEVTIATPLIRPNEPFLFQRKTLTSSFTSGDSTELSFSNLEIGKVYRLSGNIVGSTNGLGDAIVRYRDAASGGGTELGSSGSFNNSSQAAGGFRHSVDILFVAATTVVVSRAATNSGGNFQAGTFLVLEELPYHVATTKWN